MGYRPSPLPHPISSYPTIYMKKFHSLLPIFQFSWCSYTFFLKNTFSKAGSVFLKISSIWAWNVSYKFWFTPSPKNGHLQCAQLCFLLLFFFFFQISSKLNLFSSRDGVYSLGMILPVCFEVRKTLGLKYL